MAERDEFEGALGSHDSGDSCHSKHIPLLKLVGADQGNGGWGGEEDITNYSCEAWGGSFVGYRDHPGGTGGRDASQFWLF